MKKLDNKQIELLVRQMTDAATPPDGATEGWLEKQYYPWCDKYGLLDAVLELPTGELTNKEISGFVWAWGWRGKIQSVPIEKSDRLSAQGLEGKVVIQTTLTIALLVYKEVSPYRIQIRCDLPKEDK